MAGVWKLANGDILLVPNGVPVLVISLPITPLVMPAEDHARFIRAYADAVEKAGKALDEGRVPELGVLTPGAPSSGEKPS